MLLNTSIESSLYAIKYLYMRLLIAAKKWTLGSQCSNTNKHWSKSTSCFGTLFIII